MLGPALLRHRVLLGDLITQDVDEHDLEWFAGCKLNHLEGLPGQGYELLRMVVLLWVAGLGTGLLAAMYALSTAAMIVALGLLQRSARNRQDRITRWRWYMLGRAGAISVLGGLTVAWAPDAQVVPVVIALMLAYGVEAYAQFPLPIAAVFSQLLGAAALTAGLMARGGAWPGMLLVLFALTVLSAHVRIFNFYYLFATRRLRTRKLKAANDTIQLLLNQYDEHGSDCLVETDADGRVRAASDRLCRMAGRHSNAINGCEFTALYQPGPERDAIIAAMWRMKPFRDLMAPVATPDGLRWWVLSGCAVTDSTGQHTGFHGFVRDVTDRHRAESRVRFLASHDGLTQIANRAEFHARLDAAVLRLRHDAPQTGPGEAGQTAFAVMFIDLDRFKLINDSHGHAAGDLVLMETAARLARVIGARGLAARLGGDEFAVLLHAPVSTAAVIAIGNEVIAALSLPIQLDTRVVHVGASIGTALSEIHGSDGDELVRAADLAQYQAKSAGGGNVVVYSQDLLRGQSDRQKLDNDLRLALARGCFELYYQPLVCIASGAIVGFEALIRWNHPTRGLIEPGQFIPHAEESGLIVPIGEWVLREALAEAATWPPHLTVAVNVSAMQLRGGEILRQMVGALSSSGFDAARLELEITETVLIENAAQCLDVLHRLRSLGVRIALDDFGTGYSSLNYLRSFPFDKIKIDRCFVADLSDRDSTRSDSPAIIAAVLDLAARLNMETIAEGVEHESQLERLRTLGCGQVQGWLTGRPVPAGQLPIERIARRHVTEPMPQRRRQSRARKVS